MKRLVVFGTGNYCKSYIWHVVKKDTVVCFADNDVSKQGTVFYGIPVCSPTEICKKNFDFVVIFVAKKNAVKIKNQLIGLGISQKKILFYDEYISARLVGEYEVYNTNAVENPQKKSVAMVSFSISNYGGGTMAAVNLVRSLKESGRKVSLIVPSADSDILNELCSYGFEIVVYPAFCNVSKTELNWIQSHFDYAIVNGFPCIDLAYKIADVMPCSLWVHEPSDTYYKFYENTFAQYPQYKNGLWLSKVNILAVSSIAKRAFLEHFPAQKVSLFPYCVADKGSLNVDDNSDEKSSEQITFAIIGRIEFSKTQDVFLTAAERINALYPNRCRFLIIGKPENTDYAKNVLARAESLPFVKVTGALSRTQMSEMYESNVDVVVCPSMEDCLPTVITEGLMYGKICIISDNTGMVDYISDGKNGFVCKAGNADSLFEKIKSCVDHFDKLGEMRQAARKTYEENFTPEVFAKRIDSIISKIIKD